MKAAARKQQQRAQQQEQAHLTKEMWGAERWMAMARCKEKHRREKARAYQWSLTKVGI